MKFRGEELPAIQVERYWSSAKSFIRGLGFDVASLSIPSIRIFMNVPRREFVRIQRGLPSRAIEEYGSESDPTKVDGFILPHSDGYLIFIRKGALESKSSITHELFHIFEEKLGLRLGTVWQTVAKGKG